MTIKIHGGFALVVIAMTLLPANSTFAQTGSTACDDVTNQANGLCNAALAIGCDQDGSGGACVTIAERYERITGTAAPWVDMTPPDITCLIPYDGEIVNQAPGSPIVFGGRVEDTSSLSYLSVDGTPVQVDSSGVFSAELTGEWGLNFVELTAADGAGNTSSRTCTFLLSDVWAPEGVALGNSISVKARQAVFDDGNRGDTLDSFADILHTMMNSSQLQNDFHDSMLAANPLKPDACDSAVLGLCVLRSKVAYLNSNFYPVQPVSLNLVSDGLEALAVFTGVHISIRVSGHVSGISYDSVCSIDFRDVVVRPEFKVSLVDNQIRFNVRSVSSSVRSVETGCSGLAGAVLDIVVDLAQVYVRNLVSTTISGLVQDEFGTILNRVFAELDVHNLPPIVDVPLIDEAGSLGLVFAAELSSLNITSDRMLSGMGTRMLVTPAHSRPTMGAPIPPGARRLDVNTTQAMGIAVHDGVINQVLHTLWQGGYFDLSLVGGQLSGLIAPGVSLDTTAMLPAAALLRNDGRLELAIGALLVRLTYPDLLAAPVDASVAARGSCLPSQLGDDLVLDDCRVEDLHLSLGAHEFDASTLASMESILESVLNEAFRLTLNDMLPALPLPGYVLPQELTNYGLPGGSEMGLKNPALSIDGDHGVVDGAFGLRL